VSFGRQTAKEIQIAGGITIFTILNSIIFLVFKEKFEFFKLNQSTKTKLNNKNLAYL
jgi:hypothetical protein